jgi:hypothetical protein
LACPYFMPVVKLENGAWPHPARLPLGCGWNGHCTVPGHEGEIPPQDILEAFCNLGYASSCAWAPPERAWDAVRFSVPAPADSTLKDQEKRSPARVLRLVFVCERDHRPAAHGDLTFDLATAAWIRTHEDPRIQKMAECFLDSYLKKKS